MSIMIMIDGSIKQICKLTLKVQQSLPILNKITHATDQNANKEEIHKLKHSQQNKTCVMIDSLKQHNIIMNHIKSYKKSKVMYLHLFFILKSLTFFHLTNRTLLTNNRTTLGLCLP